LPQKQKHCHPKFLQTPPPPGSDSSYTKCENRGPIPGQFQADPTTLKPYPLVPVPAIPD